MPTDITPTAARSTSGYIPALDGLRAFAVVLVVAFHARLMPGGFVGVDVFFVLSAFLITRVLQQEFAQAGGIRVGRFYKRRLIRLGPALALLLVTYLAVAPILWPDQPHLGDAILAGTYVSNYSFALFGRPAHLQHTWSLAVEEQFYLIWPLLLPFVLRTKKPIQLLVASYLVVLCWRLSFAGDWESYYYRADTRCSGLIVGAALALSIDGLRMGAVHAWTGVSLIILASLIGRFGPTASAVFPLAEVGAALLIGASAKGQLGKLGYVFCAPGAILLGKLSYGIYLWHYPITVALRPSFSGLTLFVLVLIPTVALAWLSFVTVERWPRTVPRRVAAPAL